MINTDTAPYTVADLLAENARLRGMLESVAWSPTGIRTGAGREYRCRWCGINTPDRTEHEPDCPCTPKTWP